MRRLCIAWIVGLLLAAAFSARPGAVERKPLPPFTVTMLDGTAIASAQLARDGNWLLVYVRRDCGSCDAVLRAIPADTVPGLAQRVVVVIGGATPADVQSVPEQFKGLAAAAWTTDPSNDAFARLDMRGVPVVLGMRGAMIEWALAGVLSNSAELQSILSTWPQR
jgi:hypothetical protein